MSVLHGGGSSSNRHDQYGQTVNSQLGTLNIHDPSINHRGEVHFPEWFVAMDKLLSSFAKGEPKDAEMNLAESAPCLGWKIIAARQTKASAASQLFSTSAVQHSNVVIVLPSDVYIPTLKNKMYMGVNIEKVTICRFGNYGGDDPVLPVHRVRFTNCKIETMESTEDNDKYVLTLRPDTMAEKIFQREQTGGMKGVNETTWNFVTGSVDL